MPLERFKTQMSIYVEAEPLAAKTVVDNVNALIQKLDPDQTIGFDVVPRPKRNPKNEHALVAQHGSVLHPEFYASPRRTADWYKQTERLTAKNIFDADDRLEQQMLNILSQFPQIIVYQISTVNISTRGLPF